MYAVHFEDDPAKDLVRLEHQQSHDEFLQRHPDQFVSVGVLNRAGENAVGGLWIVQASSEIQVREIIESDPFFVHQLRRTIRIWEYSPS